MSMDSSARGASRTGAASTEFETEAARPQVSLVREFLGFLAHNKKWWLLPILVVLLGLSLLVLLGGTAVAPFIYTLF